MPSPAAEPGRPDRARAGAALLLGFLVLYAYFFQGGGWNQNSRFDVTRALVERGTFDIAAYAGNTGDVARVEDRVYANKPAGVSLVAVPFYAAALAFERAAGLDPDHGYVMTANAHIAAFATSALPGALLVWLLLVWFRRRGMGERASFWLAAGFGAGSLTLPYAGVMMNHNLVAFGLFAAFVALSAPAPRRAHLLLGGVALGVALLAEYLVAPLLGLYALYAFARRREVGRDALLLFVGPALAVIATLVMHAVLFGHPLRSPFAFQNEEFRDTGLLFGMLDVPDPRRIYWLTVHPFRGLLYVCPVFVLPLAAVAFARRGVSRDGLFALAVVGYFFAFALSFNGWTGGWATGPRYLIPALPFLFTFAAPVYRRFPALGNALMVVGAVPVLVVTAVRVMAPAPGSGPPPPGANPLRDAARALLRGEVSTSMQSMSETFPDAAPRGLSDDWDSYNLGELLGLSGPASLLPLVAIAAWLAWHGVRLPAMRAAGAGDTA